MFQKILIYYGGVIQEIYVLGNWQVFQTLEKNLEVQEA